MGTSKKRVSRRAMDGNKLTICWVNERKNKDLDRFENALGGGPCGDVMELEPNVLQHPATRTDYARLRRQLAQK